MMKATTTAVVYKKEHNGLTRLARNQVRNIRYKYFDTEAEARAFAATVEAKHLVHIPTGRKIAL